RAAAQPRPVGRARYAHPLLPAVGHQRRGGRTALDLDVQPGLRADQQLPGALRHPGAGLDLDRGVGAAGADRRQPVGRRELDADLPRGSARRAGRAVRGGLARRGRASAQVLPHHAADDLADPLLHPDHRHHLLVPGLPERLHPDQRWAEQRDADDGALRLPEGVPGVPDGLRLGGRLGVVHDHPALHAAGLPLVQRVGVLRGRSAADGAGDVSAAVVVGSQAEKRARARAKLLRRAPLEVLWAVAAFGGAVLFVVPFAWMLSTSLKEEAQAFVFPPIWIPDPVKWSTYLDVFTIQPTGLFLRNTVIVAGLAVLGDVLSSSLVAFGFARLRFRGRDKLFILLLATLMLPQHVTLIPHYILFRLLGWVNTWLPLIVPYWFSTPLAVFLLRQFFLTISYEVDDAARIDGAGFLDLFWRIALPLAKPAIGVVAMMAIVTRWNEFTEPLIYLSTKDQFTISVGLRAFQTEQNFLHVPVLMASSTVAVLPLIVLFFAGQRFFVQGISLSGMR